MENLNWVSGLLLLLLPLVFFFRFFYFTILSFVWQKTWAPTFDTTAHTTNANSITATIFAIQLFFAFNIHFLKHDAQPLPTVVKYICDANLLLYIETVCGFELTSSTTTIVYRAQASLLHVKANCCCCCLRIVIYTSVTQTQTQRNDWGNLNCAVIASTYRGPIYLKCMCTNVCSTRESY